MHEQALALLSRLIATPSPSRQEEHTAALLWAHCREQGWQPKRIGNNIWAQSPVFQADKPCLLLCSHHDTVQPAKGYTRDPFSPAMEDGKLYGLGSNDAGGPLVSLMAAFGALRERTNLPFNLVLALCAQEEVSGNEGLKLALTQMPHIDMAIVGEPTSLQAAVGERGLLVLDGEAVGISGHAAREEGVNALYKALHDIERLRSYRFPKASEVMGPVHLQVTQIQAGTQHNVVPDLCRFVVDVRSTDVYTNQEVLDLLQSQVESRLTARSLHHNASATPLDSPLRQAIAATSLTSYISPTTSDWIQLSCPAVKIGPGDSARSHTADEYILVDDIRRGIDTYIRFIENVP